MFRKLFLLYLLFIAAPAAFAQQYLLPNEQSIFSFDTKSGKKVMLAKDKGGAYIVYRFGTAAKIEFEFPGKTKDSWSKFKYSSWLRGGGVKNEGMDLNYVYFTNKGYTYVLYDTYFANGNKKRIGVKVIDTASDKETNISGDLKTRKGNLIDFKNDPLLEAGDQLFD